MPAAPVAVVTGGSRGIGAHLAEALVAAGYVVVRGSSTVADVTDRAQVQAWVEQIVARHGRVDLLVNNAGVIDDEVPLTESDPQQWWRTVEVTIRGTYLLTWCVARAVRRRPDSGAALRVVNLNSGAANRAGEVATAYHVAKTGLARLTGSTHASGIPCLDLMPGVVRTDMTESMHAHRDRTEWTDPDDVAALVVAFASGELDAWSGRFVRAGVDTPAALRQRASSNLGPTARRLTVDPYGAQDPLA